MAEVMELWPSGNPGGWTCPNPEVEEMASEGGFRLLKNISRPTLTIYPAEGAAADAPVVLVCPGGGYFIVAHEHEGAEIAEHLNRHGIHAAVLKYRLPNEGEEPRHSVGLEDAKRALEMLRKKGYGRVGQIGFSAGGHLTAVTANTAGPRPDFVALIYPAYLQDGSVPVAEGSPPAFLVHTMDDPIVCESSLAYAKACRDAGIPAELHLYPRGGHGYGLRTDVPGVRDWGLRLVEWIQALS